MAQLAIAILNYNGAEHLKTFLPSLIKYSPEADIIIGDNASTDNSVKILEEEFPSVSIVKMPENRGYAGGYNQLLETINADYIALVNSDLEVTEGWLKPLTQVLDDDASVAAVQPKILSYQNRKFFEYAGAGGGYLDKFGYPYCRGRIFTTVEEDNGQYDDEAELFWASGACFLLRKVAFETVGGFDESFFAHMEEIDLNWRLHKEGFKIKYTGKSTVYHLGGGTLAYDNPRKTYLNFRNGWIMLLKNLTEYNRLSVFIKRYMLDLLSIIFFLVQFKAASAIAVLRAHFNVLFSLSTIERPNRLAIEAKNNYIIKPTNISIVWQYFIRNKKRFSDL